MTKIEVTIDIAKIDGKRKQQIENILISKAKFTVSELSETSEIFSIVISDDHPQSEYIANRIIRKIQHFLDEEEATIVKISV